MSKITGRTQAIIDMLIDNFGESTSIKATIEKCHNPLQYIKEKNPNHLPLILVSYAENPEYDLKLYPGKTAYEIYFMGEKVNDDSLLDLAESVFDLFRQNPVRIYSDDETPKLVSSQKLIYQGQRFHAESDEQVIYAQRYNLLIP